MSDHTTDTLGVSDDSETPEASTVGNQTEMDSTNSCTRQATETETNATIDLPKTFLSFRPTYAQDGPESDSCCSTRNKLKVRKDHRTETRPAPYLKVRPSALFTSRFLEAVSYNNADKVKEMIQQGMSPNTFECYFNRSALHIACSRGYRDVVRVLLENSANPNIRDKNLSTPLHLAVSTESVEVVQMLLDYGTNVLLRDSNGMLALDFSIGKLRLSERIISKMQTLSQTDIHKHREKTVDICERIFSVFKRQIRNLDVQSHGIDQEKLEEMLKDFSEKLDTVRQRNIDTLVDQITNMKVKNEIDSDVNSLLSRLKTFTL
ncbi:E3 ubiquitin-protein ligase HACE1-like [Anopheles marshallii]|uniref:E3 ubiquitin-protein ligase HACE1-like n=1 Tax=Anopheles marshallii TaxID=1521116 RepID=UPI00237A3E0B|nr:E3 ubiquitin-protein ligase HACE1-like [Anopheles marshallii]